MPYRREIPRDLFNEASLLKCYGQLHIALETAQMLHVEVVHDGEAFDIQFDDSEGSLSVANVKLMVRGVSVPMFRPSNSRYAWPLYLHDEAGDDVEIFAENGKFSQEMLDFLRRN